MTRHQNITVTEAIAVAKRKNIHISRVTAIKYVHKYGLGGQLDGKFSKVVIDAKKWGNFLNGSNKNKDKKAESVKNSESDNTEKI